MEILGFDEIKSKFKSSKKFRIITYLIASVLILVLSYFIYRQFIWLPKNEKSKDSWWIALNDIKNNDQIAKPGEQISDSATKVMKDKKRNSIIKMLESSKKKFDGYIGGEIVKYLLGRQYMEKGEYRKAIENLEAVDVTDTYVRILSIGLQGDCYSDLKDYKKAEEKYIEAADLEKNDFTTPTYLFKAGLCAEKTKNYAAASKYYKRIQDDFPVYGSQKTIEKHIARTNTIKKK